MDQTNQCGQAQAGPQNQTTEATLSQIFYNDGLNGLVREIGRRIVEATTPLQQEIVNLRGRLEQMRSQRDRWAQEAERWRQTAFTAEQRWMKPLVDFMSLNPKRIYMIDNVALPDEPEVKATTPWPGWPTPRTTFVPKPVSDQADFYANYMYGTFTSSEPEPKDTITTKTLLDAQKKLNETCFRPSPTGRLGAGGFYHGIAIGKTTRDILARLFDAGATSAREEAQKEIDALKIAVKNCKETQERLQKSNSELKTALDNECARGNRLVAQLSNRDRILHTRKLQIEALRKIVDKLAGAGVSSLALDKPETFLNQ
jgi:hypothetical protein